VDDHVDHYDHGSFEKKLMNANSIGQSFPNVNAFRILIFGNPGSPGWFPEGL